MKHYLILVLLSLILPSGMRAQATPEQEPLRSARDVDLNIEVQKSTYRVGDSIDVRVTLRNRSARTLRYYSGLGSQGVALRVLDGEGRQIRPNLPQELVFGRLGPLDSLGPHGESIRVSKSGQEWVNLRDWKYDLRTPGTYTLVGFPVIAGPRLTMDTTWRSKRVTITITR